MHDRIATYAAILLAIPIDHPTLEGFATSCASGHLSPTDDKSGTESDIAESDQQTQSPEVQSLLATVRERTARSRHTMASKYNSSHALDTFQVGNFVALAI